jgi:UDPglucose 6-dehydrogenase
MDRDKKYKLTIAVAGYGPVGQAIECALKKHPHIEVCVDDPWKGKHIQDWEVERADGIVVCVATPMGEDGSCDTSSVQSVFEKYGPDKKYLVKSAIDPMWIAQYSPRHTTVSPEFLRGTTGASPTEDFLNQTFAIYGGGEMRWWHELFKPVLPKLDTVRFCSIEQAAFAKYVENTFLATKVTFFNEMYKIYTEMGKFHRGFKDFDVMVEAISNDPRVGISHTQVPGPDGKFGYGGHCFPKDIAALRHVAHCNCAETPLLDAVVETNELYRNEDV